MILRMLLGLLFLFSCDKIEKNNETYELNYNRYIDSCISYENAKINKEVINDSLTELNLVIDQYVIIKGKMVNKKGLILKDDWWVINYPNNSKVKIQFLTEEGISDINQIIFYTNDNIIEEKSKYYTSNYQILKDSIEYNINYNSFNYLNDGDECKGYIIYGAFDNNKVSILQKNKTSLLKESKFKYSVKIRIPYTQNLQFINVIAHVSDRCYDKEKVAQNEIIIQDTIWLPIPAPSVNKKSKK